MPPASAYPINPFSDHLILSARKLSRAVRNLHFSGPVTHVYNPLDYAWEPYEVYLTRFGNSKKEVIFLGMNPGPFGMAQCGIPFGEIRVVRDWMRILAPVYKPSVENPKHPVEGFKCTRSEVSGRRFWGMLQERFGVAEAFFSDHFVANYCPLAFFCDGKNITPDRLPATETAPLYAACDTHLQELVETLQPEWVIGVGAFAETRAKIALSKLSGFKIARILHPSPASPAANRDWKGQAIQQLLRLGI